MRRIGKICDDLDRAAIAFVLAERAYDEAKLKVSLLISTPGTSDEAISSARAQAKITRDLREAADEIWKMIARELTVIKELAGVRDADGMLV